MRRPLRLALALSLVTGAAAPACTHRAKQAVALYDAGDYAASLRAAEQGLAKHPGDDGLWQMRIRAALALGDADGVSSAYAAYRSQRGEDDPELLRDLAIATLGQALASPSVKLKIAAIQAVASAELHALADQVAERMGDDDDRVAASAAVAVLRGFPQAPHVASDMLRSEDAEARRIALDGVGRKIGAMALADFHKAAEDPDPRVRRAAIRWLGQLGDRTAVTLLAGQLGHADDGVRAAAARALARIGDGDLPGFARTALADRALGVRLAGIELLIAAGQADALVALAGDPEPMIALEAAIAARRADLVGQALARAAGANAWATRSGAANLAVRAVGKRAALDLARRLASDAELGVRLAAARALASAGDRAAAIAVLADALAAADAAATALAAASDLARLGDARGVAALEAAVRDARRPPDERAAAASAHQLARRVTPGLVAALADANAVVRVEAATALAMLAR